MLYVLFWIYFSYPEYNYTTVIRTLFVVPHRANGKFMLKVIP